MSRPGLTKTRLTAVLTSAIVAAGMTALSIAPASAAPAKPLPADAVPVLDAKGQPFKAAGVLSPAALQALPRVPAVQPSPKAPPAVAPSDQPRQDPPATSEPVEREPSDEGSSTTARRAAFPVGSTFDANVGSVRVHFANPYQWLDRGNSWTFGRARLSMQTDGNLVIYNTTNNSARWASNTRGSGATQMLWQPDDNLVVYTSGYASAPWASNTYNKCNSSEAPLLGMQSDSNFVVYCGIVSSGNLFVRALWASNTVM
jgi:hypothetical protein